MLALPRSRVFPLAQLATENRCFSPPFSHLSCLSFLQLKAGCRGSLATAPFQVPTHLSPSYCIYIFTILLISSNKNMECIGRFWGPPGGVGSAPRRVRALRASLRRPLAPRCPDWAKSIYSLRSSLSCCAMVGIEAKGPWTQIDGIGFIIGLPKST